MLAISRYFWQMCMLSRSPAELPATQFVVGLALCAFLAADIGGMMLGNPERGLPNVIIIACVHVVVQGLATWGLLMYRQVSQRFLAAWSALLGTNAVIVLVSLPFAMIVRHVESPALVALANSALWVCVFWWLSVAGFIYRHSSGISWLQSIMIAALIELISVSIAFNLLLPS